MNANELRIGSLVYFNGTHKEIGLISGITTDIFTEPKVLLNDRIDIPYQLSSLKPIPLTEEWLLNFGFEKDGSLSYRYFLREKSIKYDIDDNCICISDSWEWSKIKYVHQLQNLYFALTNEELTLKK